MFDGTRAIKARIRHDFKILLSLSCVEPSSRQSHNDLKPGNVLFKVKGLDEYGEAEYKIKLGDFGNVNRSGGTPGWTWPRFMTKREPGKSDLYSTGMLILYVMCENEDIFYKLRNNYVEHSKLSEFRDDPLIKLIIDMRNLNLTVQQCRDRWDEIQNQIGIISENVLRRKIGTEWLEQNRTQDNRGQILFTSVVGISSLSSTITQSVLMIQEGNLFCWNYSISRSINQSMFLRLCK